MAVLSTNIVTSVTVPNADDRKLKFAYSEFDADVYAVVEFGWETGEVFAVAPESTKADILAAYYASL